MPELQEHHKHEQTESNIVSEPLTIIELDGRKITILGTAHVSRASVDKVQELIATNEYDAVAIELCPNRHKAIIDPDAMAKMDLFKVVKSGQASMVAASLALSAYQQRMADQFGIEPGAEMKIAITDARAANLPIALIDREIGITLKRVYRNIPWWKRFGLFSGLFASIITREEVTEKQIEHLKEGDVLESTFSQFAEDEKHLFKPLIHERDQFMSASLIKELRENDYQHILAIVGAGHMNGMDKLLKSRTIEQPGQLIDELNTIPEGSKWLSYLPWAIVALILIGFAIGFSRSPELGLELILDWVLINGGFAALGAAIAMAHPLTILTAFIAAPLTSLNPMIGAGMVTAAAEIYLRKPQVRDFSQLKSDATTLKGWWNNQVTRVLMIFVLSSFGSAIGTYVAGFRIFDRLSGS